jgi:hypothetical protein
VVWVGVVVWVVWVCGGVGGVGCGAVGGVVVWGCGGVGGGFPLRSNIPRSALCATLDTYNFFLNIVSELTTVLLLQDNANDIELLDGFPERAPLPAHGAFSTINCRITCPKKSPKMAF